MSCATPIKAHQQAAVPLLRKPRPPKPVSVEPSITTSTPSEKQTPYSKESTRNPLRSTPAGRSVPATPRTTPYTPFREHHHHYRYNINPCIEEEHVTDSIDDDDDSDNYSRSGFIIHDTHPRGPCFFPPGKIFKSNYPPLYEFFKNTEQAEIEAQQCVAKEAKVGDGYYQDYGDLGEHFKHRFMLNDFQLSNDLSPRRMLHTSRDCSGIMMSQENYLKLTGWFANNVPTQEKLNTVDIRVDHNASGPRKPQHQALIELRAMVNEALESSYPNADSATTLSEDLPRWPTPTPDDVIFKSSTTRYFCGEGRTDTPFDSSHQPFISPSEVAILECMIAGGSRLSLKAHFIKELPVLSPLAQTLTYLNLSFNNFKVFPLDVLELGELVCLKMRNNPLKEIPNAIASLNKLRILCLSFNLLSDLPPGLFNLSSLEELDVSYNTLHLLSRDIRKFTNLHKLNVEGNQLVGLPFTAVSLPLSHLLVGDNLMHPLLWRENTRNEPQALVDLCCVMVSRTVEETDDSRLPSQVVTTLQSHSHGSCDQCRGVSYGPGLRVIRAISHEKFKVKNLPFIFTVCSPRCRAALKKRDFTSFTDKERTG